MMITQTFDLAIPVEIKDRIVSILHTLEQQEGVSIVFAIESGSRAWGFPSPDSDYDVRFVYVHALDWYLAINPGRDVIELPIDGELDINGWDLRKALGLLLKPNPVLLEWLSSPVRYLWNDVICEDLATLSRKVAHGSACLHHYLHLGERQWRTYVDGKDEINLKKYFYIVRPAMALRWIRLHPTETPPMNFQALLAGIDLEASLVEQLQQLLIRKGKSKELGKAKRIPAIDRFVTSEFALAKEATRTGKSKQRDLAGEANELFRQAVRHY